MRMSDKRRTAGDESVMVAVKNKTDVPNRDYLHRAGVKVNNNHSKKTS